MEYLAFGLLFLSLRYDGDRAAICMFFFKAAKYIHLIGGFFRNREARHESSRHCDKP